MNGPQIALTALLLFGGSEATAWPETLTASSSIRDIHGPLQTGYFLPFSHTAMVLGAFCLILAILALLGKKSRRIAAVHVQSPLTDDLAMLRSAYDRKELPAGILFQRLIDCAASRIVSGDWHALTGAELRQSAGEKFPGELATKAASLFATGDRVRFGCHQPETAIVDEAFETVRKLLTYPPGGVL
jgi:hypothetical protein